MDAASSFDQFDRLVRKKFGVFNSLFLSLPFRGIRSTGVMIPLLQQVAQEGLAAGKEPLEILDGFFHTHTDITTEADRIDFMFRVVQYVERQVVLYDSVEDAAFAGLQEDDEQLSLKDYLHLLEGRTGKSTENGNALTNPLADYSARIVFTAHPTQFYPPTVLGIIERLRSEIAVNDIDRIDRTLQQLGLTTLLSSKNPTPFDEALNIIYFLRHVYYEAVGELIGTLKRAIHDVSFDNPDLIRLGFWPGGDRDGNPFVTVDTTRAVADELRMSLMKCYYSELKELEGRLTFQDVEGDMVNLRDRLYEAMFNAEVTIAYDAIIKPLHRIRSVVETEYNGLYLDELDAFINRVRAFRTHFATLDIRQNHDVHARTVASILKVNGVITAELSELSRDELIDVLLKPSVRVDPDALTDDLERDTVATIRLIPEIQATNGEAGCNRYVISHAEDVFSVLYVFALLRWCTDDESPAVDIIPLFESMEGMGHSAGIMDELFRMDAYRGHVRRRKNRQTMMLGFSDGTKDGGYLRANWAIHKTKEALTSACRKHDIEAVFFDGRGGPPARGGGKTHRFYAAQGSDIANHAVELTIQGQTITSKFGTKAHFTHNCEQLLAAGLHRALYGDRNRIRDDQRELLEELARGSYDAYTALKNDPLFVPYLEQKSTLKYYSRTHVGSRPASRGSSNELNLDNLRAIPFVGSWSQLKQNVPGYFGVGTAIRQLVDAGRLGEVQALFQDVPFFKTLILNSMMSLSKCRFELTAYLAEDPRFGDFWKRLLAEFELSKEMVLLISGYDELMQEEQSARASIAIREELVIPLLIIQQYALQKVEQDPPNKDVYEKIVTRSLYGNINASRNSA